MQIHPWIYIGENTLHKKQLGIYSHVLQNIYINRISKFASWSRPSLFFKGIIRGQ